MQALIDQIVEHVKAKGFEVVTTPLDEVIIHVRICMYKRLKHNTLYISHFISRYDLAIYDYDPDFWKCKIDSAIEELERFTQNFYTNTN